MNKTKEILLLLSIIIIAVCCAVFYGNKKQGYHEDEYYSYYSTNMTDGWGIGDGSWAFSERYYQEFVVLPGEEFNYSLVKTVQSWDVHPPMYYWFLHTICSIWKNTFSKWQGLILNIFFYIYGIIFLFLCMKEINKQSNIYLISLLCLAYALNTSTITSVMFIRMYSMIGGLILSSIYLHIKAIRSDKLTKWYYLLLLLFNLYIGELTHYYFLIYHFFITLSICIYLLIKDKNIKRCFIYGFSILFGVGLGLVTFPAAKGQLFSGYRGTEATSNLFNISNTLERLKIFTVFSIDHLFINIFILFAFIGLLIAITIFTGKIKNKANPINIILLITFIGYYFIVSKTGLLLGNDSIRYIYPIFSLIYILLYSFLINRSFASNLPVKILTMVVISILFISNIYNHLSHNIYFLYPEDEEKIAFAKEHSMIPVVFIYQKDNSWRYVDCADELLEYQVLYFISDSSSDPIIDDYINNCNELLVYIRTDYDIDGQINRIKNSNPLLDNYELIFENKYCNLYYFN